MEISRLAPISISLLGVQTLERRYSLELHTRLGRRGSDPDHYLDPSLEPRKSAGSAGRSLRGPQRQAPSLAWGPHFQSPGRPTGGVAGAGAGSWVPRLEEVLVLLPPQRGPLTSASGFLTQRHPPRRRTYRPERAPGAGERTGRLAGGCARASVRVCVCPCLYVTGAVRSSVRLRVRGRPVCRSVRGALSPALLARSLPNRPTKCAWAAESRAQLPGLLGTPRPSSAPPPDGLAPLPGNCAGLARLAGWGRGAKALRGRTTDP